MSTAVNEAKLAQVDLVQTIDHALLIGIRDIPADQYHAGPGISKTGLWTIHTKTPEHFRFGERVETKTMALGSAIDVAITEPARFDATYARLPDDHDGRTNVGKQRVATWQQAGLTPIKNADYETCLRIRDRLHADPVVQRVLSGVEYQRSAYWIDPITGELCRCRPDLVNRKLGVMPDLKLSSRGAGPDTFSRTVAQYGYHVQDAFYRDGWQAATGEDMAFMFIVYEDKPPYAYAIYELQPVDVADGREIYRKALATYSECRRTDTWPSYPAGVQQLTLPRWARTLNPDDFTDE